MTKSRKRKNVNKRVAAKSLSTADALTISIVWLLNVIFSILGSLVIGLTFFGTPPRSIKDANVVTIAILLFTLILWINAKYISQCEIILLEPKTAHSIARLKTLLIRVLSLQPFQLITASIPALTAFGYTTRFSNWLLDWIAHHRIGDKASVGVAWVGSAIVSGVIGNLAYALLRFAVKKMYSGQK